MRCVHFAALLTKIQSQKTIEHEAILQLFAYMLEQDASDAMISIAKGVSIPSWFEWISNLKGLLSAEISFFEPSPELEQLAEGALAAV